MTLDLRAVLIEEINRLTPETDPAQLAPDADLREALDFDSMDILNLSIALGKRLGVMIPERDTPALTTLGGALAYLEARVPQAQPRRPAGA